MYFSWWSASGSKNIHFKMTITDVNCCFESESNYVFNISRTVELKHLFITTTGTTEETIVFPHRNWTLKLAFGSWQTRSGATRRDPASAATMFGLFRDIYAEFPCVGDRVARQVRDCWVATANTRILSLRQSRLTSLKHVPNSVARTLYWNLKSVRGT